MKITLALLALSCLASVALASDGYDYEPPAPKLKFNIGFNVPSMSISLPKLELPQISIRAAIRQKKPFTLQLPRISFSSHVSAKEEDEEPVYQHKPSYPQGGNNYGGGNAGNSYAGTQTNYLNNDGDNYGSNGNQYGGNTENNYGGGYRASAPNAYERPAPGQYPAPTNGYQEEGAAYQPAAPAPQQNNYGQQQQPYATGFQGQAVSDYKSSATNNGYYTPAAPAQRAPAVQYSQRAYQPQNAQPALPQAANGNYGQRNANNGQEYQRRTNRPSGGYQASEQSYITSPFLDFSQWRPIIANERFYY